MFAPAGVLLAMVTCGGGARPQASNEGCCHLVYKYRARGRKEMAMAQAASKGDTLVRPAAAEPTATPHKWGCNGMHTQIPWRCSIACAR